MRLMQSRFIDTLFGEYFVESLADKTKAKKNEAHSVEVLLSLSSEKCFPFGVNFLLHFRVFAFKGMKCCLWQLQTFPGMFLILGSYFFCHAEKSFRFFNNNCIEAAVSSERKSEVLVNRSMRCTCNNVMSTLLYKKMVSCAIFNF